MLVYHPAGDSPVSTKKLLLQAASHLCASSIASYVLSLLIGVAYLKRVLVVALLGVFSSLAVGTIYWNWYGFPTAFFLAQCLDLGVGCTLAGVVIAGILRPRGETACRGRRRSGCDSLRAAK